jgi:hypothetical protein
MAGWLVLTYADDTYQKYETPGETRIDVATNGYPTQVAFTQEGVISAEWFAEEPEVRGKSVEEALAEEDEKAAKEAAKAAKEEEATATSGSKK